MAAGSPSPMVSVRTPGHACRTPPHEVDLSAQQTGRSRVEVDRAARRHFPEEQLRNHSSSWDAPVADSSANLSQRMETCRAAHSNNDILTLPGQTSMIRFRHARCHVYPIVLVEQHMDRPTLLQALSSRSRQSGCWKGLEKAQGCCPFVEPAQEPSELYLSQICEIFLCAEPKIIFDPNQ